MLRRMRSLGGRKDDESLVSGSASIPPEQSTDQGRESMIEPLAQGPLPEQPTTRPANRLELLRPPEKTKMEKFKHFFWDPEKKACMTRTPINWLSITVFYILFVAGVLLVFVVSILLALLVSAEEGDRPQYVLDESPIGGTPGLNFFPLINRQGLFWVQQNGSNSEYVDAITKIFDSYKSKNSKFNTSQFGECASSPYGYDINKPCIFLRLNRLILWKPKPFLKGDKLPENMPKSVATRIENGEQKIWVTCNGTTAKDRDHFSSEIFQFQGVPGFDPKAYPFTKQADFLDPIIAFRISDEPNGVIYEFSCTAWGHEMNEKVATLILSYYFE